MASLAVLVPMAPGSMGERLEHGFHASGWQHPIIVWQPERSVGGAPTVA